MKLIKNILLTLLYGNNVKKLVAQEAKALRKNDTKQELDRLDFRTLEPSNITLCIYGQITGNCFSDRANDLIFNCAKRVYNVGKGYFNILDSAKLNGKPVKIKNESRQSRYFSPIEYFIAQKGPYQKENNEILVDYLKGERKDLNFL